MSWYIGFERRFEFDWLREPGFWEVHLGWLYFGAVDTNFESEPFEAVTVEQFLESLEE